MSTSITYKGSVIATVDNNIKTLKTAGKYLEADVVLTEITTDGDSLSYGNNTIPMVGVGTVGQAVI